MPPCKRSTSPEAIANAYELAFLRLERDEGPINFDDDAEREKCRQDGLRVVAAYLDSPEAMKEKPRAVEVMLKEDIPGLSVPLTGAMDLVEGNFTPVDFKSAAAKPDEANAAFDHEIQLVSYQLLMEAATGETPPSLDLVFLVKTKKPQTIRRVFVFLPIFRMAGCSTSSTSKNQFANRHVIK